MTAATQELDATFTSLVGVAHRFGLPEPMVMFDGAAMVIQVVSADLVADWSDAPGLNGHEGIWNGWAVAVAVIAS
jgi:hypothetical protein